MKISLTYALPALALAGVLGLAQTGPASAANEDEMAKNAKVSISQAVDAAEAKAKGKATEVEFDDDYGGRWEVKVLSPGGDTLIKYFVDPNTGQVVGEEEQTFEKYWTMLKPADFQKAQVQLKDAIMAAEKAAMGKATSAEVERSGDAVAYEIDVITDQGSKDVSVDATGKVVVDD
ncbi:PepSY domain-containing protein [Hansschlegelia beijingensis]|uniref:PepSY domain-containing protein n=1 Tax=Hansschlegelia beijingensis TaxID=1133344 RepID=UPI00381DA015